VTLLASLAACAGIFLAGLALCGARFPSPLTRVSARDLALALGGAGFGVAAAAQLGVPALGLIGLALPFWWRRHQRAVAQARAERSVVPTLEALVGASRAGIVFAEALAIAANSAEGDLQARMAKSLQHIRFGASPADALHAARHGATGQVLALFDDLELCARARFDSNQAASFMDDVLTARRFQRDLRSEVRARTAGLRFQIWLLAALVPGLALYLSAMSPTLADQLMSPLGRHVLIPTGAVFEIAGIVLSRRVVARACD
jgi:Flp pilus assembly protein TadB